jgi:hypothetical protein
LLIREKLIVQLVNNEVFPSSLNNDLTNMFLDLKDGAKIVSLKPFVPEGFRMNESNVRRSSPSYWSVMLMCSVILSLLSSSLLHIIMLRAGSVGRATLGGIISKRLIEVLVSSLRKR